MQFNFLFGPKPRSEPEEQWVKAGASRVRLHFVRHRKARRYVLRLRPDGAARVTIPRGGSAVEATRFVQRNIRWLERQLLRQAAQPTRPARWSVGSEILFRGNRVRLEAGGNEEPSLIRFGTEVIRIDDTEGDLRPALEQHLWRLATCELPARTFELAAQHQLTIQRVTVRDQRSRWGSCSRRGTISLNWRLVQTLESVRDYIILHELAHLREMNHSQRFWREVRRLCPWFEGAEKWLKEHAYLLR